MQPQNRQLAAILFTDIVGYTAMMQQDEQNAVTVTRHYMDVLKDRVAAHGGTIMNDYGDGSLCTFTSATAAVRCAMEIQQQLQAAPKVSLRIGLHIGEIIVEQGKVMGDGVNIASRIQSLGQANTILFSKEIFDKLRNQPGFQSVSLGLFEFKNVDEPMEVFALANEGLNVPKRENMEGKLKVSNKNSSRRIRIGVGAILFLLVISFLVYKKLFRPSGFNSEEKSIAILPFKVIGTDIDNMSDGLVEDILVHLSKISELNKVISNRSSSKYLNSPKTPTEIGEELKVNSLVMGSIQQIGDTIRVSAQLIESKTGNTLWADNYTREKKQLFNLETEVATHIVTALKAKLTPGEENGLSKHYTDNVEAYKYYRKGRAFWDARSRENFDSAKANYKRALEMDPDYALAYAGLADCYTYNQQGLSQMEAVPIGRDYALKALSLDSNLSEALTTLGWIQGGFDYEWGKSKTTLQKAIKLNPNYPLAHMYYGNVLQYTGENTEEGIKEVEKALELDPLSVSINWVLGRNYWLARQYGLAYDQLKKTITLDPRFYLAKSTLIYVDLAQKKYAEAFELIKQLPPRANTGTYDYQGPYLSYAYAFMGDTLRAKKELEKTIAEDPGQSPFHLARCNIILKNYSIALDELEQAYNQRDIRIYNFLKADPTLDPVRNEPRFKALLKKTGLD
jgi:adenylate cyclase